MSTARVFVVDRSEFFGGNWPQGFVPVDESDAGAFLSRARKRGRFEPRPIAEQTPAWKQWIPYCFLRSLSPSGTTEGVFLVQRTKGQSETRLHGLWSIGLGGHIEPEDGTAGTGSAADFFSQALARELHEELFLPPDSEPRESAPMLAPTFLGVLNDDETPVGAVHAGLVYRLDVRLPLAQARKAVKIREISKMSGGFGSLVELANLWQDPSRFETWSRFLIHAGIVAPIGDFLGRPPGGEPGQAQLPTQE